MSIFDPDKDYVVDGDVLDSLWRIAERLNDGERLHPDQRRDLGQRVQVLLTRAVEHKP